MTVIARLTTSAAALSPIESVEIPTRQTAIAPQNDDDRYKILAPLKQFSTIPQFRLNASTAPLGKGAFIDEKQSSLI